jgi:hypothetical protein
MLIASDLATLDPPTDDELTALRSEVDPTGRTIAGEWITLEESDGGLKRVREAASS